MSAFLTGVITNQHLLVKNSFVIGSAKKKDKRDTDKELYGSYLVLV